VRRTVLDLAAELLERLRDTGLRELEVRHGGVRVRVSADGAPVAASASAPEPAPAPPTVGPERAAPAAAETKTVSAPLTGIFYRSASAQAGPFVQAGAIVNVGDVIGLIEAMKLFNEVRSTIAGRVRRVIAENGQLVRAHQPLIELE
jgi:acetyl-CoA carboxylase biotin carboxyl carrier protein